MMGRPVQLSACLTLVLAVLANAEDVFVTVDQGVLRGKTATGVYNTSYSAFVGIPFAEPPLGELRFKAPVPAGSWEGIRDATQYGSDCVQIDGSGSEDCLYLNVYVPGVPQEGANIPVLFWVHGGAFVFGSGSDKEHGPDFLIAYDVILVTTNYRLGPLGFLSTDDEVVPGNAALKDQNLALSWVQKNIARFGGDPRQVTLQGQSAGGVSISLHLVSPMSADLFSRLIDQSGTLACPWGWVPHPRSHAFKLGAVLGFETDDSQQLVKFLQTVNATDLLVDTSLLMTEEEKKIFTYSVWAPNIEPDLDGAFITESPIKLLNEGRFHQVTIMIGVTSAELGTSILSNQGLIDRLNDEFDAVLGPNLHLSSLEEQLEAARKIKYFYFGNETLSVSNPDPLVHMNEDIGFLEPTDAVVRRVTEISNVSVYYYEFDYHIESESATEWGVSHSAELPFLFLRKDAEYNLDPASDEERVRRNVLRLWTSFTKYGNPTPEADPVVWEPYDLTSRSYLLIQANITLDHNKDDERMDFWSQNVPLLPYPGTS